MPAIAIAATRPIPEAALRALLQAELRQVRDWLDHLIEDEQDFTPEFERSLQEAERDMASGQERMDRS